MVALAKELNFTPDVIVAGSGSAGTAAYFCAGQYDEIKRAWTEHLVSPLFVNKFRLHKIMDINYLVDIIFKKKEPLRVKTIIESPIQLIIAATRKKDKKVIFFEDWNRYDVFEVLRATKSIPYICNRGVKIEGELYSDSMRSSGVRLLEEHMNLHTYDAVIIVRNGVSTWVQTLFGAREMYLPKHKNVILVQNDTRLGFSMLNNSKKFLDKQFTKGYNACLEAKKAIELLKNK